MTGVPGKLGFKGMLGSSEKISSDVGYSAYELTRNKFISLSNDSAFATDSQHLDAQICYWKKERIQTE